MIFTEIQLHGNESNTYKDLKALHREMLNSSFRLSNVNWISDTSIKIILIYKFCMINDIFSKEQQVYQLIRISIFKN